MIDEYLEQQGKRIGVEDLTEGRVYAMGIGIAGYQSWVMPSEEGVIRYPEATALKTDAYRIEVVDPNSENQNGRKISRPRLEHFILDLLGLYEIGESEPVARETRRVLGHPLERESKILDLESEDVAVSA